MRIRVEKDHLGYLIRLLSSRWVELAYIFIGIRGLQAEIELPSDWHEHRRGWVRLGFGLFKICFSFPWKWVVPDHYQCSGPTFGFTFFDDSLHLHWGKTTGHFGTDPIKLIQMPWGWRHKEHKILSEKESWPYTYVFSDGTIQFRVATIYVESRLWTRPWFPRKMYKRSIDVSFNAEVGERSGSWKGGCTGCSYNMLPGESPLDTLRRMERERKFT